MSTLVINGTTFSGKADGVTGNQSAWIPTGYEPAETKDFDLLEADNKTRNLVGSGAVKRSWKIIWQPCNAATMATVRTISRLTTTFAFVDFEGTSTTVQAEDEALEYSYAFRAGSTEYWNVTLTLYEP